MVAPTTTEVAESHLSSILTPDADKPGHGTSLAALALCALGVVFGDIGTSPLYTLKECLIAAGGAKTSIDDLFGILSMMFWSLIMVVTVKYLTFIMRANHDGEGGIFALLALVPERFRTTPAQTGKVTGMALLAVIGASLLYGDGVITPAISVLSAVEGLAIASPRLSPLVVPLTCAILVELFWIQKPGTGDIGKLRARPWRQPSSDRRAPPLSAASAHTDLRRQNEYLAIADLAGGLGSASLDGRLNGRLYKVVVDPDLQLQLLEQVHIELGPTIDLREAQLPAVSQNLQDREPEHLDRGKRFLHNLQLVRLDNGDDQLHDRVFLQGAVPSFSPVEPGRRIG